MKAAFGRPHDEVFSSISERPVAAASLGQVYRAQLKPELGGDEVAVKVLRPGVLEQVQPTPILSILHLPFLRQMASAERFCLPHCVTFPPFIPRSLWTCTS